ncbi:uncharacterized protein LOC119777683 [Cyprinodon tularosa]|uniref:uncharacterized protein LOC119777683 n=1 Tax=Cyprinodon tularosa TaxID=77115 RepID=UPI0018E1DB10|nr:uncharacterized protein LOC119777683 [Cyprinodon tularosa]
MYSKKELKLFKYLLQRLKMSTNIRGVCVALLLTLTSVYAARRSLNCINDLINCHQSERTNVLELLHWFACEIGIDQYNNIRLTFDPNSGAYGSHRYINQEGVLDQLPPGYQYYTIGNIHRDRSGTLPSYVVNSQRENIAWNSPRILVRVNEYSQTTDQVYITQHYDPSDNQGSVYDSDHTYRITTSFLRQLKKYSINKIQQLAIPQPGPFRNSSSDNCQEDHNPEENIHIEMHYTPTTQGDCPDCQSICICFVIVIIIIIFLIILGSYFYSRK